MPLLGYEECQKISETLMLIGESNRLRIVLLCYDSPHSVSEIADKLQLSLSLTSHHLRLLRAMRVLKGTKKGKQVFYALHDHHIHCILKDIIEHLLYDDNINTLQNQEKNNELA